MSVVTENEPNFCRKADVRARERDKLVRESTMVVFEICPYLDCVCSISLWIPGLSTSYFCLTLLKLNFCHLQPNSLAEYSTCGSVFSLQ